MIVAGVLILVLGIAAYFFADKLKWIGRLPGDIRIEKENVRLYVPITTMLLLSILISIVIQIIRRL